MARLSHLGRIFRTLEYSCLACFMILGSLAVVVLSPSEAEAAPVSWAVTPSPNQGNNDNYLKFCVVREPNVLRGCGLLNFPL